MTAWLRQRAVWLLTAGAAGAASAAIVMPPQGLPAPASPAGGEMVTGTPPATLQNSIQWPNAPTDNTAMLSAQAMEGDVVAMFALGSHYYANAGLPQARAQASRWWRMGAEAGDGRAMAAYGYLLAGVNGGTRDLNGARQWLQRAQSMGVVRATYLLALVEMASTGPKQKARARTLLEQAARQGDAYAMNDLAVEYELDGNVSEAVTLYTRSAQLGVPRARQNLQRLQHNQKGQDAEDLGRLRALADEGNADALLGLAQRYHLGQGVRQDYARAIAYYRRAADAGSAQAREFLALIFSRKGAGNAPVDGAWMQELAARINAAAMGRERRVARPLDRPARIEDPLADFTATNSALGTPVPR